ncbi:TetR/AcrR family transcriptional regulator [Paracoccus sp. (in: a-proteobacteria)]|uniref:TetR/AcrR family transcriptional regulator n=1 Tax=Paracoccus sp. TaxID=267 RepID=UPI0026DED023|nr:TetR/AcrR family transcriptional regulator [Paracoccus sp. (in: a-proteobacteria)]MDO5648746.1 helix-turn-helix domain-containing protein [Paracoccus sp. (in: a-proteobacteria)]
MAQPSARDRLLHAAAVLFYNDGIAATGIDAVIQRAGVARQSLYNNFGSKAELVAAYLTARHDEWLALYQARLADAVTPQDRVLAVFDAYQDHADDAYERGFRGCGLLNAAAELAADDPGRAAVRAHKEQVQSLLRDPLVELNPTRADATAQHLAFLLEGAITRAGLERSSRCVADARVMAETLIRGLA